jgi:hypothetical protein
MAPNNRRDDNDQGQDGSPNAWTNPLDPFQQASEDQKPSPSGAANRIETPERRHARAYLPFANRYSPN